MFYTADFETGLERDVIATGYANGAKNDDEAFKKGYNKVFLWALCPIEKHELLNKAKEAPSSGKFQYTREYIKHRVIYGNSDISVFFKTVLNLANRKEKTVIYFHNLSYDGEFIVYYLLSHGWEYSDEKLKHKQFRTLITELKVWYSIELCYDKCSIIIKDSYKLISQSEEKIISDFKIDKDYEVSKTEIDFMEMPLLFNNGSWRKALPIEIERVTNDVLGMAIALGFFKLDANDPLYMKKDTAASCAFDSLKASSFPDNPTDKNNKQKSKYEVRFKAHYPRLIDPYYELLDDEKERKKNFERTLRTGYFGGYCYVNPLHASKTLDNVVAYDQNSKYPTHMVNEKFPYGRAFTEEEARALAFSDNDLKENWVYIVEYRYIEAHIKPTWIPWVQKHGFDYHGVKMMENIEEEILVFPQPLNELFLDSYDISDIALTRKYYFRSERGLFNDHVYTWMNKKIEAGESKNGVLKFFSKIMMNSSYGKFAQKTERGHKIPYWDVDTNDVKYMSVKENNKKSKQQFYLPVGMFISAYARADIVRKAHSFGDKFVYCDTDSLHLIGTYTNDEMLTHGIKIHNSELGAWKLDKQYSEARYLHAKCYAGIKPNGVLDIHVAGFNCADENEFNNIKLEDIYVGSRLPNKRGRRKCRGGCVLVSVPFEIKKLSKDEVVS